MGNKCCTKRSSHVLDTQNDLRMMKNKKRNRRSEMSTSRNSTVIIRNPDSTGSEASIQQIPPIDTTSKNEYDINNIDKQILQMDINLKASMENPSHKKSSLKESQHDSDCILHKGQNKYPQIEEQIHYNEGSAA